MSSSFIAVRALWHVSDDPSIARFEPRDGLVWAIAERHVSKYWFPRDCPRGTWWAGPGTTAVDVDRFLSGEREREVHAIQADWLDRFRTARLSAYRLPPETFDPRDDPRFYFTSAVAVEPLERRELGDLLDLHAQAGIELRIVPDLAALWAQVIASTVEFSGNRLGNLSRAAGLRT
jgi:hypothetical protein